MDPLTTAILSAIAAGVVAGTKESAQQVIKDGYNAIKELLKPMLIMQNRLLLKHMA